MQNYFEIWDEIILMEIIWRISIEWEDWDYTLSFFDKSSNFITDIWYCDRILWEDFIWRFQDYLDNL